MKMYEITGIEEMDHEMACDVCDVWPVRGQGSRHQCHAPAWHILTRNGLDGPYTTRVCSWHLSAFIGSRGREN